MAPPEGVRQARDQLTQAAPGVARGPRGPSSSPRLPCLPAPTGGTCRLGRRPTARRRAWSRSRPAEDRVGVRADVVVRPEIERPLHGSSIPFAKERLDVALEADGLIRHDSSPPFDRCLRPQSLHLSPRVGSRRAPGSRHRRGLAGLNAARASATLRSVSRSSIDATSISSSLSPTRSQPAHSRQARSPIRSAPFSGATATCACYGRGRRLRPRPTELRVLADVRAAPCPTTRSSSPAARTTPTSATTNGAATRPRSSRSRARSSSAAASWPPSRPPRPSRTRTGARRS